VNNRLPDVWEGNTVPKHVLLTLGVALSLFVLIWFGVFVVGQTANEALLVSVITIVLVGIGIGYSRSTLRRDRTEE
jgi:hypothetical protein